MGCVWVYMQTMSYTVGGNMVTGKQEFFITT